MRRVWVASVMAMMVLAAVPACGRKSYEERLSKTLEQLEYTRRLNKNLMPPPGEKKFQDLNVYFRPPKEQAPAKTVQLPVAEGQFDLEGSFLDKTDSALHILARVKMPKKAAAKGAPPAPPPPQRGSFESDVLTVLASVFGPAEGLQTPKFSEEIKRGNRFKRLIFAANDKEVKVYTYKQDTTEVALIFVYAPAIRGTLASKIDLCLETFATGAKANRLYTGGAPEEEAETAPSGPV